MSVVRRTCCSQTWMSAKFVLVFVNTTVTTLTEVTAAAVTKGSILTVQTIISASVSDPVCVSLSLSLR